jgi:hypothetical protein
MSDSIATLVNDRWVAENLVEALHTVVTISSGYVLYLWIPVLYEAWIKGDRNNWFYTLTAFCIIKFATFTTYGPYSLMYWAELDHGFIASKTLVATAVFRLSLHVLASALLISRAWHYKYGMWYFFWRWLGAIVTLTILLVLAGVPPWDPPNIWYHDVMPWEQVK